MNDRLAKGLRRSGDYYHKHVYSRISPALAKLTDYNLALTDVAMPFALYSYEQMLISGGLLAAMLVTSPSITPEQKGVVVLELMAGLAMIGFGFMSIYAMNTLRTPIDHKIGLPGKEKINHSKELTFVIKQLNQRAHVEHVSYDEAVKRSYEAVDKFLQKHEGYTVPTTKRVKRSKFSNLLIWKMGAYGLLNPFLHEVITTNDQYPEDMAHEFAHLKGIPQERLAQFVGIASLIDSDDPYLQYLGYRQWLSLLMVPTTLDYKKQNLSPEEKATKIFQELSELGLDSTIIAELQNRDKYFKVIHDKVMSYSWVINKVSKTLLKKIPKEKRDKIPKEILGLLLYFEPTLAMAVRKGILKLTGQRDIVAAYVEEPLKLLRDYRNRDVNIIEGAT